MTRNGGSPVPCENEGGGRPKLSTGGAAHAYFLSTLVVLEEIDRVVEAVATLQLES